MPDIALPPAADNSDLSLAAPPVDDAASVARGVARMFARADIMLMGEVSLPNRRRADLMGIDAKGHVVIIEIKICKTDLLGDRKWEDYLAYCDRFYWAISSAVEPALLDGEAFRPADTGVIIADAFDAAIARPAPTLALSPARRKPQVQMLARRAMQRLANMQGWIDPEISGREL